MDTRRTAKFSVWSAPQEPRQPVEPLRRTPSSWSAAPTSDKALAMRPTPVARASGAAQQEDAASVKIYTSTGHTSTVTLEELVDVA